MEQLPLPPELVEPLAELCSYCETMYAVFYDFKNGAVRFRTSLEESIRNDIKNGMTRDQARSITVTHVRHRTEGDTPTFLLTDTIGAAFDRTAPLGANEAYFGNMCLVAIDAFWNEHTRNRLAKIAGVTPKQIEYPLFGDIRAMRNMILKHRGIADSRIKSCTVLK